MKTNLHGTIGTCITAALAAPALAIESPACAPPPAAAQAAAPALPAADDIAYLGVVSSEIPRGFGEHLNLDPGHGIIVRALQPGGPAAKSGIAANDIITAVAGIPVGSARELSKQIRKQTPGKTVVLNIIHKGQPSEIHVTLGKRPPDLAQQNLKPLDQLHLEGVPEELTERIREAIDENIGKLNLEIDSADTQLDDAVIKMRKRFKKAIRELDASAPPDQPGLRLEKGSTIRLMDDQGSIELKSNDDGRNITVRDKNNQLVWKGPWNTPEDKAAAPENIRKRVKRYDFDNANRAPFGR